MFDFSYQNEWKYFELKDTITVEIIKHLEAEAMCGTFAFGSISIVKNGNDTIRIINLCNMTDYKLGDTVKFIPATKPDFNVHLPYSTILDPIEKKLKPSVFDLKIKKTTYGNAIR